MKVGEIAAFVENIAPKELAIPGDCVGLQIGSRERPVAGALVALDPTASVAEDATRRGCSLVLTHHPLLRKPLAALEESDPIAARACEFVRRRLALYCAHTNLDAVIVAELLARKLGLEKTMPLEASSEKMLKLVFFAPPEGAQRIADAVFAAGAGTIGEYSRCAFSVEGAGSFRGSSASRPAVGRKGRAQVVSEARVETVLPARLKEPVRRAILSTHPYEEPAYDFYPLSEAPGTYTGIGRVGDLPRPVRAAALIARIKKALAVGTVAVIGPTAGRVRRVAVQGGSGGAFMEAARRAGAQFYLCGEINYHDALRAAETGMTVVEAGHDATEYPVVPWLARRLREAFPGLRVAVSRASRPRRYL